jgi:cytidine deaminase
MGVKNVNSDNKLSVQNKSEYEELVSRALIARDQAYAPYSKFKVGAAVKDEQGRIFTGCNIENSSYGASNCAERTAIFKAVSSGSRLIKQLAVVCDSEEYCRPCGICRQVMSEFASVDFCLLSARPDGSYQIFTMDEILPHAFSGVDITSGT